MRKYLVSFLGLLFAGVVVAQFVAPPRSGSALTIPSGGYKIGNIGNGSNIASPVAFSLQGTAPLGMYINAGSDAAAVALTQVLDMTFQLSQDGTLWQGPTAAEDHQLLKASKVGITNTGRYFTLFNEDTLTNISMYRFIRLYSITNPAYLGVGSNNIWITNLLFIQGVK